MTDLTQLFAAAEQAWRRELPAQWDARFAAAAADGPHAALRAALAFSCRALWARGTLVAFLEHISHRLPGGERFLITASKSYRDMQPEDCCLLDMQANWIDGPRPPGFKWFHAQLLRERSDVQAVVHTHDLYGRAYAQSPRRLEPIYRVGLDIATCRLPMYARCDLIVDPEVRRQTLDALGTGPVVHEVGHGTDFVADKPPDYTPDRSQPVHGMDALSGRDPFIMIADGKSSLFVVREAIEEPVSAIVDGGGAPAQIVKKAHGAYGTVNASKT